MHDPIFNIFREETREHLQQLERGFLELDADANLTERAQIVAKLFRHAHNLKGDARALDLDGQQQAAGQLEETLEQLRDDPAAIDAGTIEKGLSELDLLQQEFERWESDFLTEVPPASEETETTAAELAEARFAEAEPSLEEPASSLSASAWGEDVQTVRVSSERLDRMLNLVGEVRVLQRNSTEMQRQLRGLRGRLDDLTRQLEGEVRPLLESLFNQIRRVETTLHRHETREQVLMQSLEDDVSAARLLPLTILADSLRRPIRDLAKSLGKNVRYHVDVGDVLLDKAVIESLRAPLMHLIRNALDHGIEDPQTRLTCGKPAQGLIHFQAGRRGEKVVIQISDDGAGPDFNKIRQQLLSRGLLSEAEIQELSPEQLSHWLFHPGFSTTEVGDISGRGVGLDVVRDSLQRMQGRIELDSHGGIGTTFTLVLPVTLSTIRVLTVWCLGQCFGLPSSSILKTDRVKVSELRNIKGTPVIQYEGELIRWLTLADLLQLGRPRTHTENQYETYVVIRKESRTLAVRIDSIEEEREVLLKPLSFPLSGMPGVLGGTVRSDGSVQLVLDVSLNQIQRASSSWSGGFEVATSPKVPKILVVDDSPTTRAILRNVLAAAGYQVRTAVDGIDALEKLRVERPNLVVCDFEMPRLNGVDLTRQIKAKWNLPVILVTGREKEHHRREGLEAGADAYVIKSSFHGESLLDVVRQMIVE